MKTKLGKVKKTSRGFQFIEFKDANGDQCSVQISSVATEPMLWLGQEHESIHHVTKEPIGSRMHLNQSQVYDLVQTLKRWLKHGDLK